uniref:(northern house mosquito) hypothetical protein n=1 Tax=Culex pipiens TaxID=7175 RepID=A0A8D8BKY3_CULPI
MHWSKCPSWNTSPCSRPDVDLADASSIATAHGSFRSIASSVQFMSRRHRDPSSDPRASRSSASNTRSTTLNCPRSPANSCPSSGSSWSISGIVSLSLPVSLPAAGFLARSGRILFRPIDWGWSLLLA